MKLIAKFALLPAAPVFLAVSFAASNQPLAYSQAADFSLHQPDFSLTISAQENTVTARGKQTFVSVNVTEKNISRHTVNIGRPMNPAFWYKMDVILDGSPAPFTKLYTRLHEKRDPNAPVIFDSFLGTLKPGQSQNFSVTVSDYFDFSTPGHYEITFSRGTDPGQPDNAVVQSNTITITVIPANTPAPESTNPSPFPNASETTPSSIVGPSPTTVSHGTSNPSTPTTTPAVSIVAVVKPEPAFTLNIEADPATARTYPALHRVLVTLTNVSSSILVNQFHTESLNMYNMVVLRNGIPAPETDAMKALAQYRKVDRFPAIRHPFVLYPGQTYTTSLDVSDYYDMSQPGTYQITITRQSLPLNPAYSTLVRSNSITTTVPPQTAASQSAETMPKPQPRFDLNISPEDPYAPVPPVMVRVEMENTSNSVIRIAKCWTFMGMYDLQVTRDGQPVPPTEEMLQLQKARAAVTCPRNDTLIEIKPGDSYAEDIPIGNFYDVSKPGVYQVYVTRQTYPWDPQKSILVQSNPISFQVPVSSASAASDSH